jgi:hypothetical protein
MEHVAEDTASIKDRIAQLKMEHRDLDDVIGRLNDTNTQDELQLRRLKRRKLMLKDQISWLERQLTPDLPACAEGMSSL